MRKIIFVIIIILISIFVYVNVNAEVIIPNSAIRFRVIPNSNSVMDQNMKIKVKNYVNNYMSVKLNGVDDVARDIINSSIDEINRDIKNIFKENNYNMDFKIKYGNNYFPDKVYKGVIYKKGSYESLVIYIGKSYGDNWWCVLFPPLCLLDADEDDVGEVEYRSFIRDLINNIF